MSCFFLISGYIISQAIQKDHPVDFLIKRFFRIYPLYIFAVLCHTMMLLFIDSVPIHYGHLISQLLLVGDFFNTPHSLNGVEWTLRIEMSFYIYMFFMSYFHLTTYYKKVLPWIFLATVLLLGISFPIPSKLWNTGYFNMYVPFLFLGALFWSYENKEIKITFLSMFAAVVFFQYWHLIDTVLPGWRNSHFSALAVALFSLVWILRTKLVYNKVVLFISELTYAVYLIHNWFFDYASRFLVAYGFTHISFYSLLILMLTSTVIVRLIERPGNKLGRQVLNHLNKFNYRQRDSSINIFTNAKLRQMEANS